MTWILEMILAIIIGSVCAIAVDMVFDWSFWREFLKELFE